MSATPPQNDFKPAMPFIFAAFLTLLLLTGGSLIAGLVYLFVLLLR